MPQRPEAELVEAARGGDLDGFGELYRRHYAGMVGLAYCVLGDRHLAEDAAQETFAIACRDLWRLRSADKFAPWIGGICRRVAKRMARSRRREVAAEQVPALANARSGDGQREAVQRSVEQLPRSAREVVVLCYFAGLSHNEIAATLGISRQAVHGRLVRARRKIAEYLGRNGLDRSQ